MCILQHEQTRNKSWPCNGPDCHPSRTNTWISSVLLYDTNLDIYDISIGSLWCFIGTTSSIGKKTKTSSGIKIEPDLPPFLSKPFSSIKIH